jgi:hypothetical protein
VDDETELLRDHLDGANVHIVRLGGLDLAGRVVFLPAPVVRQDFMGGGERAELLDRSATVGM